MAYTVLARKYRSRGFDEVIGQKPIATTLVNAIRAGRIHHGYLFTGTRGVGKTSMARILAKALNCLRADGPTPTPCNECDACRAISEGQDLDVVEIDAASNTGVDNIRELRSNTAYRPARSRFKVYIIDEVHMLSTGAFNALLKTLEEPPEHVKFILATTEIQKVPATIQSRCQRFNFRNIGPAEIEQRLADIVKAEQATAEPAVLRRVARLANGSMRDALSILDQLLSVSTTLTADLLDEILPPAQDEQILALLKHAAAGEAGAVLAGLEAILAGGRGLDSFCNDTIESVRSLMLIRACGPDAPMVDLPAAARDEYVELSRAFELSQYVQIIAMLEELRRNVRFSGAGRALADACLVRIARMRQWTPIEQLLGEATAEPQVPEKKKPPVPPAHVAGAEAARPVQPTPAPQPAPRPAPAPRVASPPPAALPPDEERPAWVWASAESAAATTADYDPGEIAATPRHVPPPGVISSADRTRILREPVVQQVMELFSGELAYIERRPPTAAQPTE